MLNTRLAIFLVLILYAPEGFTQTFDKVGSAALMAELNEREKVRFVNDNFYKLYSADFANATELSKWASEIAHARQWPDEEARAQMNWGVITFLSSDYKNVLPHFFRSLHLFDSLQNKSGIAAVNNEMAVFYHKQKDNGKAEAALDAAEAAARASNDLKSLSTTLHHRGVWLSTEGNYKDARPFFEEVLRIRTEIKDPVGLSYVYLDFAEMALNDGDFNAALKNLNLSTEIRRKLGDKQGVVVNLVNTGETYFAAKKYKEALPWFLEGLQQGKEIGFTDLVRHTNGFVARTYEALNDYKNAYKYQEEGYKLKDSLFNIERTKVIQDMEAKYETEKKNQTIAMLDQENKTKQAMISGLASTVVLLVIVFFLWRNRNQQRHAAIMHEQKVRLREAQINAVIESQETERRRFATDLHDGMGQLISALQMNISSLRGLNTFEKRDQLFESSEQLLNEAHDEIRNIAFNLMPPVLVKEGLVPAVQELARKINKNGKIKAEMSVFDVNDRLTQVAEISLYRVIQELLSNIIKYSKATNVTISFTGYENELVLTIDDDGNGYDLKAFQESKEGNGWRNVNSRISLIKGSIEIDTQLNRRNSTVIITIPVEVKYRPAGIAIGE
ncbi:MAG TPA: sensor histidine kinase [Cyclobacteriaceae bacterium]|nr:sensor histidine kinase [Cyclobacteriaceae bacterium]